MNSDSVDLIYLDPPFNSKANYAAPIGSAAAGAAFKDTWSLSDVDVAWLDLLESKHPALNRVILAALNASDKSYLIYMAVRLLEMKRILKPKGSIYLHCDSTMSHYLKLAMDAIFGRKAYRNEITWRRYWAHNDARSYGRVTDSILYYAQPGATWTEPRVPLSKEDIARRYSVSDKRGRYATSPLHARTLSGGAMRMNGEALTISGNFRKTASISLKRRAEFTGPNAGVFRGERSISTNTLASF